MKNTRFMEMKNHKVGELYAKNKNQRLVQIYNHECTMQGKFPNISSILFGIMMILLLWLIIWANIFLELAQKNTILFLIMFVPTLIITTVLYSLYIINYRNFHYIKWLRNYGICKTFKYIIDNRASYFKTNHEKIYLDKCKEDFNNNELNDMKLDDVIKSIENMEIKKTSIDYNSIFLFFISIITIMKIENINLTFNYVEDVSHVFYILMIVFIPSIVVYLLIYNFILFFRRITSDTKIYDRKIHYFSFLDHLNDLAKEENANSN